jgi:catechol 2,3-dioxygenase-like lactoylglutathione lyase family enzyme
MTSTDDRPVVGMCAFRSADPSRLAAFSAELMQLPVSAHSTEELVMLDFDHVVGPVTWMFHRDPEPGDGASRLGLDLGGDGDRYDWRAIAGRAEEAGATRIADREAGGIRWVELTDPDGNPFRVFAPRP